MTSAEELVRALPIRGMRIRAGTYGNCGGVIFAGVDLEAGVNRGLEVIDALTKVPDWAEDWHDDIDLYIQSIGEGAETALRELFDTEPAVRLVLRTVQFNPVDAVQSVGRKAGRLVVAEAVRIAGEPAEADAP